MIKREIALPEPIYGHGEITAESGWVSDIDWCLKVENPISFILSKKLVETVSEDDSPFPSLAPYSWEVDIGGMGISRDGIAFWMGSAGAELVFRAAHSGILFTGKAIVDHAEFYDWRPEDGPNNYKLRAHLRGVGQLEFAPIGDNRFRDLRLAIQRRKLAITPK